MNRFTIALLGILLLSVGFNLFLWYSEDESNAAKGVQNSSTSGQASADDPQNVSYRPFAEIKKELDVDPLRRLLEQGEYLELGRRLNEALKILPNNTELLLMEAEYIAQSAPLSEAILNYYSLLERPLDKNTRVLVQGRIDNLVTQATQPLKQEHRWDLLAQFMEPLFQRMPQNKAYTLLLAEAYGQQENFTLMENTLASLAPEDAQAAVIRNAAYSRSSGDNTGAGKYRYVDDSLVSGSKATQRIALIRAGDQFLVDLIFEDTPVRMLVDTGASTTALSARTYERLSEQYDSQFLGVFDVNTAGGQIRAAMVTFDSVTLGNFEFKDLTILVIPNDPFDQAEGLLGMNVLKAFDFKIDQRTAMLHINEL